MAKRVILPILIVASSCCMSVLVTGCSATLPPSMVAASGVPAPSASQSTVVFVRPSSQCDRSDYTVVADDHGRFVGNVAPGTQVGVSVAPGPHVFYGWSSLDLRVEREPNYNTVAAVKVDAEAGKTEYVALVVFKPAYECIDVPIVDMFAIRPHAPYAGKIEGWVASTTPMSANMAAGQAALDARPALLQTNLELGQAKLRRLNDLAARNERHDALLTSD